MNKLVLLAASLALGCVIEAKREKYIQSLKVKFKDGNFMEKFEVLEELSRLSPSIRLKLKIREMEKELVRKHNGGIWPK